jgi:hypothetical protein
VDKPIKPIQSRPVATREPNRLAGTETWLLLASMPMGWLAVGPLQSCGIESLMTMLGMPLSLSIHTPHPGKPEARPPLARTGQDRTGQARPGRRVGLGLIPSEAIKVPGRNLSVGEDCGKRTYVPHARSLAERGRADQAKQGPRLSSKPMSLPSSIV